MLQLCGSLSYIPLPVQDVIPADRMAAVAHLPGIEKLLRCMLVRDPARRATLADISRRQASHSNCYLRRCSIDVTLPRPQSSASAAQSAVTVVVFSKGGMGGASAMWAQAVSC